MEQRATMRNEALKRTIFSTDYDLEPSYQNPEEQERGEKSGKETHENPEKSTKSKKVPQERESAKIDDIKSSRADEIEFGQ